ncbi:putative ATP-dependent RNA helicase TDRD12 [Mastacembelus armatus]|uniref:putative ATP-dependent RNA helicase TDRD12 n=1 Tax=Mastacembelus armatus TaxID=205130 RepID=UPI000E45C107|nr:putative ATP-dependent RNA helicase TDRD12 [Mastacembelus armatus]
MDGSSQKMLEISILKIENPSCLWGRVIWSPSGDPESTDSYNNLQTQMNHFYNDVRQDPHVLKPTSIEEGQVCVAYWSVKKSWCRAMVESVFMDLVSCTVRCLLVDYGEQVVIPTDQIRVAAQNFLQLPFRLRRFCLGGIKPVTLRVSVYEKAELIPSTQWDNSASLYVHNLLRVSTQAEAVLLKPESDATSIQLYLTIRDIKICVNDDLVAKRFAYYSIKSDDDSGLDKVDRFPVMLPSSVLYQTVSTTPNKTPAQTHPSPGKRADAQQHELKTSLRSRSHLDTAAQSDSSVGADSSSAAGLSQRLLGFLNRSSNYQQAAPSVSYREDLDECRPKEAIAACYTCASQDVSTREPDEVMSLCMSSGNSGTAHFKSCQVQCLADEESSSTTIVSGPTEKTWSCVEDWACSRLLEWLNPKCLNPNPDAADAMVVPSDARRNGILVYSAFPVEPCNNLDDAPITDSLRRVLRRKQYTLSPADRHSWPAVARGCNTLIVSQNADQPHNYLTPLLTHILLNSVFSSNACSRGPIAVLLCRGWEKVQVVYDLLEESNVAHILHPIILLVGVGIDEAKSIKIPKNCLLLVTTPFSLTRLMSCHCFMFLRLYHLVLDEADQLFTHAPDQMETILQHFQKVTSSEENVSCPQQLIAIAKQWTNHMEGLLRHYMPCPCFVLTIPEEAALYGNVQQIVLLTLESSKLSVLLGVLDLNPDIGQKTLIVADSAQEVEDVFKALSTKSAFCFKTHKGLMHQSNAAIQQWRKDVAPGTHVILVTTTDSLKCLGITDATCVIQYSFPTSPKLFGSRLFCMVENFRNLSGQVSSQDQTENCSQMARSVLLISERDARHVVGILRYLGRTKALMPPELLSFAQDVLVTREHQKTNKPLCSYLKSFGACRDSSVCPHRHRFISWLDRSELPASGVIEVVPLYIKTASVFYGRIVRKDDGGFHSMMSEMASYYANKKPGANEVLEGSLYAVQEDDVFHRVKILSVPNRRDCLFFSVLVQFIDVGKEEEVKSHQILQLPEQFHVLPGQAVEIIVCRVKPVDGELEWHPKVTRAISQKVRGLQHRARAVLSLGDTVFVDPMVRVTQVPGIKTAINEYNIQSEILSTGMGVCNPEHVDLLRALCSTSHGSGSGDGLVPPELRINSEEAALAEAVRAAHREQCVPLWPLPTMDLSSVNPPPACGCLVPAGYQEALPHNWAAKERRQAPTSDRTSPEELARNVGRGDICTHRTPTISQAAPANFCDAGDNHSNCLQLYISNDTSKSFHPQVLWYQTSDRVIVTVKLRNPESQRCDFYPDRVVYRGRANGQLYEVDLQLQANISAESCCWEMKCNEPVLKLVKQQHGHWEKLLRNKNVLVTYDMEHLEEDENRAPPASVQWFVGDTGEDHWFVDSESRSDTDD